MSSFLEKTKNKTLIRPFNDYLCNWRRPSSSPLPSSPHFVLGGGDLDQYLEQEAWAPSSHLQRASGFLQQVAQTFALACAEVRPLFTGCAGLQLGGRGQSEPLWQDSSGARSVKRRPICLSAPSPRVDKRGGGRGGGGRGGERRGGNVNRNSDSNVSLQVFINLWNVSQSCSQNPKFSLPAVLPIGGVRLLTSPLLFPPLWRNTPASLN